MSYTLGTTGKFSVNNDITPPVGVAGIAVIPKGTVINGSIVSLGTSGNGLNLFVAGQTANLPIPEASLTKVDDATPATLDATKYTAQIVSATATTTTKPGDEVETHKNTKMITAIVAAIVGILVGYIIGEKTKQNKWLTSAIGGGALLGGVLLFFPKKPTVTSNFITSAGSKKEKKPCPCGRLGQDPNNPGHTVWLLDGTYSTTCCDNLSAGYILPGMRK